MKTNKLITMFVSLLAAICLWIYVVTVVNPDGETVISNIPVTFTGVEMLREDQSIILADDYELTVSAHFYGKNADLKKLEQNIDELQAVVDVSRVRSAKEYALSYELHWPSAVQESAFTISDMKPSAVNVAFERQIKKEIPINPDFSGVEIAEGYMLESTTFDYSAVTVEGPESVVNTIQAANVSVKRQNVDKSFSEFLSYTLVDAEGNPVDTGRLTADIDEIELSVGIIKYKVVPLKVQIVDGGGATEEDCDIRIEPASVTISGDGAVLDSVKSIVLDTIDLSKTANSKVLKLPIFIPNDAANVSGEEEATVTLKVLGKQTKIVKATSITFTGVQADFEAESIAQQVQITVRASDADINKIGANNTRVVVDLSGYSQAGTYQLPAEISFDGFPDAGVIGEYTVAVNLKATEE